MNPEPENTGTNPQSSEPAELNSASSAAPPLAETTSDSVTNPVDGNAAPVPAADAGLQSPVPQQLTSSPKSRYVTDSGIDFVGEDFVTLSLSYDLPFDDDPIGFGRSITPRAMNEMIGRKIRKNVKEILDRVTSQNLSPEEKGRLVAKELSEDRLSIEFGKESLLRMLSQPDTVGIRFTLCHNVEGQPSLVAMAVVKETVNGKTTTAPYNKKVYHNVQPVQKPSSGSMALIPQNSKAPMDEEQGVGTSSKLMLDILGLTTDDIIEMVTQTFNLEGNKEGVENALTEKITHAFFAQK